MSLLDHNPPPPDTLHGRFAQCAAETPDRTAVTSGGERLTYGALNDRADRLAARLRADGVGPDTRVGLYVDRSVDLVAALLGILRAGGAYVPIDPATPDARAAFVLADAGVRAVVTSRAFRARAPLRDLPVVCVDDALASPSGEVDADRVQAAGETLAYVIYTSGTTGRPKGVMVEHASVLRLMEAMRQRLSMTPADTVLGVTTPAFDLSVPDFFLPLTMGAHLLLATEEEAVDPERLAALVGEATLMQATPATWRMLLDAGWSGTPHLTAVSGGDALPEEVASRLAQRTGALWNFYGPTEATVWATCERVLPGRPVGLGVPFSGVSVSLRDDALARVNDGATGEVCIGGWGLARGYLGQPALTAERFVTDADGERIYRTGDLARKLPDSRLLFVGRADTQVKVRGHRIELGEIASVLTQHPSVAEAAVLARDDHSAGTIRIVAYVVGAGDTPDMEALGHHLAAHLPEYMLPAAYVTLDAMPLTDRLKVDRAALPAPPKESAGGGLETETERGLAVLWRRVLGTDAVGRADAFVALGGHSLLAVRLVSEARRHWRVRLALSDVFRHPTLGALAAEIDRRLDAVDAGDPPDRSNRQRGPLTFAQRRLWFLDRLHPGSPFYTIARAFRLRGRLDASALQVALDAVVRRHDGLRTTLVETADGDLEQVVDPDGSVSLHRFDTEPAALDALLVREASRPFRLDRDLPVRAVLIRLGDHDHAFLLAVHHTAADGWSMPTLFADLARAYAFALDQEEPTWDQTPLRTIDYAQWQQERSQDPSHRRLTDEWRRALDGAPPLTALPPDRLRPDRPGNAGARISAKYPPGLGVQLDAFAQSAGVTPFVTALTAYAVLLASRSNQNDLVVGVNTSGRERVGAVDAVGLYVNMVPVRIRLDPAGTWTGALGTVREAVFDAFDRAAVPFEHVIEAVRPERRSGAPPLVQTVFSLDDTQNHALSLPNVGETRIPLDLGTATFDTVVDLVRDGESLRGTLEYRTDLYDPNTAQTFLSEYGASLGMLLASPDQPIASLQEILSSAQQRSRAETATAFRDERRRALGSLRRRSS